MRIYILLIMGMLCSINLFAQTITVLDDTDLKPISNVVIMANDGSVTVTSNQNGQADLSNFKNSKQLYLSHISYHGKTLMYSELTASNYIVKLLQRSIVIDELVVSASRFEEKQRDVAQPVQILRSKELTFINQSTTADVLTNSGNVLIQKSQQGGGSAIIRGFETNKVLMVVDGVRMNNAIYRGGHIQNVITLDNSVMDKVEVVYGPGSVVYGSDALGGVMHFYTKNPILADSNGNATAASAMVRYGSANNEKTVHVDANLGFKRFGSFTSITYSDFGDLSSGKNRNPFYGDWGKCTFYVDRINGTDSMITNNNTEVQKRSGYKQYDVLQKFTFRQSNRVSHMLNVQLSNSSDINRYDRLVQTSAGLPKYAEWYYGPQTRFLGAYSLNLSGGGAAYDEAKITAAYQYIEESRHDRKFKKNTLNNRIEKLDIVTLNADFQKQIGKNELRYGFDGWYNGVNSTAHATDIVTGAQSPLDTRYPDGGSTMQSMAVYATHAIELGEHWVLNDGIRVNKVKLESTFNDTTFFPFPFNSVEQNNTALNGNIGLVYMPTPDWRLNLVASTGFRAPNVDDLSKVFESVPGNVIVPNPNLEPERTYNLDLGITKSFNNVVHIGGEGYYTWYLNAITTVPGTFNGNDSVMYNGEMSRVMMNTNAGEAYIYGLNAFLNADVTAHFSILNTVNYTYGRIKTDTVDYPLDHIPPVFGKTSFVLKLNKFRGDFVVMYNGAKKSEDYNLYGEDNAAYSADPDNGYMPSWMTLNMRTAYQINRYLQLQLAVDNLLDQHYRVYASNISAPGRNVIVTLRGTF